MGVLKEELGLLDAVRGGRCILFLGAGASRGAKDPNTAKEIPDAKELGKAIADEFLGSGYHELDFKTAYDYSCSNRNTRDVQAFVHKTLYPFNPTPEHLLIPNFVWAGIATTNYDLIIERAYEVAPKPLQRVEPCVKDGDGAVDRLGDSAILYLKLHGCITRYQETKPPLIASSEQLINHADGRSGQFALFLEWAKTRTLIFAGYGMNDHNLRTLIDCVVKEGDNRPRHYIVKPDLRPVEEAYWRDRRFNPIPLRFGEFLNELDQLIRADTRVVTSLVARAGGHSFTRFIAKAKAKPSQLLLSYLDAQCEHVTADLTAEEGNAKRFFNGFEQGWYPIQADIDVKRRITRTLLEERVAVSTAISAPQLIVVKGHAGSGKSIILRRVAWESGRTLGKLTFYLPKGGNLSVTAFEEIVSLTKETIVLVIDSIADSVSELEALYREAKARSWPLLIIGGVRVNEWNMRCDDALDQFVEDEHVLNYLSRQELLELLEKLDESGCLGELRSLTDEQRLKQLTEQHGRQLLVALHEATKNDSFSAIVANEYNRVFPEEARVLYLDICAMHRFGSPVRAGLIARLHGVDYTVFKERFFAPLEDIVDLRIDRRTQDYSYHARHPLVADMVYMQALKTMEERFENTLRLVTKLNVTYSYDQEVMGHLVRASALADLFPDHSKGSAIYDAAMQSAGRTPYLLHQRGIYEMRIGNDPSALNRAERCFNEALEQDNKDRASILHSIAELSFARSKISAAETERTAWRRKSIEQASELFRRAGSSHSYHTAAKCHVAGIRELMGRSPGAGQEELYDETLSAAIKGAEEVLRSGLQRFPGDSHLLSEEAELAKLLSDKGRSLKALRKAFDAAPQSELIARRLALLLRAAGDCDGEIEVLKKALAANPGSRVLHYDYAMALLNGQPNADRRNCDVILHHLARSYTPGGKDYQAQFWHARQLYLAERFNDARSRFEVLKRVRMPYSLKAAVKGPVLEDSGEPARFNGVVISRRSNYGFVRADDAGQTAFFSVKDSEISENDILEQTRASFALSFNFNGAIALNLSRL